MNMMQHSSLLKYKNYRYLKLSSMLLGGAVAAYIAVEPSGGHPYGGTWLGYVLGTVSILIIFLLTWYGIYKRCPPRARDRRENFKRANRNYINDESKFAGRRRADRRKQSAMETWRYGGTVQGWLSAHVYLGASLIVLSTLHAGFQFGWNVHTLSYVLMLLVIASGFYGMYAYLNFPKQITQNMADDSLEDLLLKIAELDELIRIRALGLPDEANAIVLKARQETLVGGNILQQIIGFQRDCPTSWAVREILRLGKKYTTDEQPKLMRDLFSLLLHKEKLVLRARTEIMLKARLKAWLHLHVPLTLALLAALFAHIVAIFFYW